MRVSFVSALIEMAEAGHDIHLLTGDLGFGLLDEFQKRFPERYTNMGVSEANMVGVAAGMAMRGKRVFCYSIAPFVVFRALEQIRCDLCGMNLPVTIVPVGAGLAYGMEGMTHFATEDLAIMRALPNMTIYSPADPLEAKLLTKETLNVNGPCYLRLGAKTEPDVYDDSAKFQLNGMSCLQEKGKIAILATGTMVLRAKSAIELLKENGLEVRLFSLHTIKPFSEKQVLALSEECEAIVTIEEHSYINGIGSMISEILFGASYKGKFLKLGIPDEYSTKLGHSDWMRDHYNLDPGSIAKAISEISTA
jgi:transketolase